jgi:hypothetical protein
MNLKIILFVLVSLFLVGFLNSVSAEYLDITESEYSYVGNYYPYYPNGQNYLDYTSPYAYNSYNYVGYINPYTGYVSNYGGYYGNYNVYPVNYYRPYYVPRNSIGVYSDGVGISFSWS